MITYNFVIDCSSEELVEFRKISSLEEYQQTHLENLTRILAGSWAWCLQAYVYLKQRASLSILLSNEYDERYINIVHSDTLIDMPGKPSEFIVCVQADYTYRGWTHFHIVQNKNQIIADSAYMPLWVHPGLIKRDDNRVKVERVAYAGQTFNNNLAGTTDTWNELISSCGVEFVAIPNNAWHDLSKVDILVGVRSFDLKPYDKKPPSKLVNAWHAQIPFVGGHDSAYKQIGVPGEDYLLVSTPEETAAAIKKLRDEPELYAKLVRNGTSKAAIYTQECIIAMWEELLTNAVLKRYEVWKKRKAIETVRFVLKRIIGLQQNRIKKIGKKVLRIFS